MRTEREHLADALEGLFSLAFLDKTDNGVDYRHSDNYAGIHPFSEESLRHAGNQKNINENIIKVLKEPFERPFFPGGWKPVRAEGLNPIGGLGTREAVAIAPLSVQDIIGL